MLHAAPTSETKAETAQSKTQVVPQPERELHPHLLSPVGLYSPGGMNGAVSDDSRDAQRRQTFAGMQNTHGNQAVLRMLHSPQQVARMTPLRPSQGMMLQRKCACGGEGGECAECHKQGEQENGPFQTKLRVSQPGDQYEQEADQVAEQVMRMTDTESPVSEDEDETKGHLMRKQNSMPRANAAVDPPGVPPIVHIVLSNGGGQPLDATTRAFMEPRFGHDFSQVRVHTDKRAAESAQAVNALAYTVGKNVVFGAGQYTPGTSEGRRLMAHELTHVVQQGSQGASGTISRQTDDDQAAKVKQMNDQYSSAVSAEQWDQAALSLNGFSDDDITKKLRELSPQQLEAMRDGALKSMPGWSDRVVKPIEAIAAQQNEQSRIAKLEHDYKTAVTNEDWDNAASLLNAYSDDDIATRLDRLSAQQLANLKSGAERSMPGNAGRITSAIDQILNTKYPVIKNDYALKVDGYFVTSGLTDPLGGIVSACDQAFYLLNGLSNDDLRATLMQVERTTLETLMKNDNYAQGKYDVFRLRTYMQVAWKARFPDVNPPVEFEILPSSMPGKSEQDFLQQVIPELAFPVWEMSTEDKVKTAIKRAMPQLPGAVHDEVEKQLPTVIALTLLLMATQGIPFLGATADVIFLVGGITIMGVQVLDAISDLLAFGEIAVNAQTDADLNHAATLFMEACTIILVNVILAIAGEGLKEEISGGGSVKIGMDEEGKSIKFEEEKKGPEDKEDEETKENEPFDLKSYVRNKLQDFINAIPKSVWKTVKGYKTIALGLVEDADGDPRWVYTVSGDWTNPALEAAADELGIMRWKANPRVEGRGDVGAPLDAEQLLIDAADTNDMDVVAIAPSRPFCPDCEIAVDVEDIVIVHPPKGGYKRESK